jgi:hypothetical protein
VGNLLYVDDSLFKRESSAELENVCITLKHDAQIPFFHHTRPVVQKSSQKPIPFYRRTMTTDTNKEDSPPEEVPTSVDTLSNSGAVESNEKKTKKKTKKKSTKKKENILKDGANELADVPPLEGLEDLSNSEKMTKKATTKKKKKKPVAVPPSDQMTNTNNMDSFSKEEQSLEAVEAVETLSNSENVTKKATTKKKKKKEAALNETSTEEARELSPPEASIIIESTLVDPESTATVKNEELAYDPYAVAIITGAPSPPAQPEYQRPRQCCDNAGAWTCCGIATLVSLLVCICCIIPIIAILIIWKQSVNNIDTLFEEDVWLTDDVWNNTTSYNDTGVV